MVEFLISELMKFATNNFNIRNHSRLVSLMKDQIKNDRSKKI